MMVKKWLYTKKEIMIQPNNENYLIVTFGLKVMKQWATTNLNGIQGCTSMNEKNFFIAHFLLKQNQGKRMPIQFQQILSEVKMERFGLELIMHWLGIMVSNLKCLIMTLNPSWWSSERKMEIIGHSDGFSFSGHSN